MQLVQQQRRNRAEQQLSFSGSAAESSARGAAAGCKLDVLSKLNDVKSMASGPAGRGRTLLQLLVSIAEEQMPQSRGLVGGRRGSRAGPRM